MFRFKLVVVFLSALIVAYGFIGGVVDSAAVGNDVYRDLSVFMDILHKIREEYVEKPDMDAAIRGALRGMVESLDAYSSFVDAQTHRELLPRREEGATPGLILSKRFGYAYVVSVLPGSSAAEQGLRTADVVESIEGETTASMSLWEAESRLMGAPGSEVAVRVIRARRTEPTLLTLKREPTSLQEASSRIAEEGIGLLRIPHFKPGAAEAARAHLKRLRAAGAAGLLIDVRGTALGDFQEAARACGLFLKEGSVAAKIRQRDGRMRELLSQAQPEVQGLPIIVLINRGTSGAAELFAAALRDHQVAETLGERTNGQGAMQESFRLQDGSVLYLSTERIFRPNGEPVQGEGPRDSGLAPDLRWPSQDFETNFYYDNVPDDASRELGDDFYRRLAEAIEREQFRKAVEEIREMLLNKKAA